jgi:hypothetical protein
METFGEGLGSIYKKPKQIEDTSNNIRKEKTIIVQNGDKKHVIILRDFITAFDPYLNMVRAAAYSIIMSNKGGKVFFPVPPVDRKIRDALVNTGENL